MIEITPLPAYENWAYSAYAGVNLRSVEEQMEVDSVIGEDGVSRVNYYPFLEWVGEERRRFIRILSDNAHEGLLYLFDYQRWKAYLLGRVGAARWHKYGF